MAIDMVLAIKKENNKKHRLSISSAFRKGISNNIYCNLEYHIQLCLFVFCAEYLRVSYPLKTQTNQEIILEDS